ncbi:hypothetical protein CDAR_102491, partial [Caerostris darwini]
MLFQPSKTTISLTETSKEPKLVRYTCNRRPKVPETI